MGEVLNKRWEEKIKRILSEVWWEEKSKDEAIREILGDNSYNIFEIYKKNKIAKDIRCILNDLNEHITINEAIEEIKNCLEDLQKNR